MKNFTLATVNTINEKCVSGAEQLKNFQNKKIRVPGLPGTGQPVLSCPHPLEQRSDQKFQNKVYRLFFWRKFLKTGVVAL